VQSALGTTKPLPVAAALARLLGLPLTYDAHELYPEISTLTEREAAVGTATPGRRRVTRPYGRPT
jgi:hypothetical protein